MINRIIYSIIILLIYSQSHAQSVSAIQNIDFNPSADGKNIKITYDIVNSIKKETFYITIGVFTESEKKVNARTLTGDIGENITGGTGKQIVWDVIKDNIVLDEGIYIEIDAKSTIPEIVSKKSTEKTLVKTSQVTLDKAILLSALFPGLGNSKITGKKSNLAIGAFTYGSIASAFLFMNSSNTYYSNYLKEDSEHKRENYYEKATNNKNIAGAFAITAGTVWLTNIIITAIQSNKQNLSTASNKQFSIIGMCDYKIKIPAIGIMYNF